ncbi:MAG: TRAP transporter small permease subunit [Alphaproteobacteria bacterium]|nr:TRAP transporter small permease subunit [Alphaproteobacteria bacterium]
MERVSRAIDRLSGVTGLIAGWLIMPLIAGMCYEVIARYVFHAPTIWAYELTYLLTGAGWLLGMAYTLRQGAHIRIDVVYLNFSPRNRARVDVLGYVFLLLPFLVWLVTTLDDRALATFRSGEKTGQSAWNPPLWPFRAVFFAAFLLLTLQVIAELMRKLPLALGIGAPGSEAKR